MARDGGTARTGWGSRLTWPLLPLGLGLVLGVGTWVAWRGGHRASSYDATFGVVVDQVPDYTTLQVLGCALSLAVVTALLAARWNPVAAVAGTAAGFWSAWCREASGSDPTGLWVVGAVLLAGGLVAGTALAAGVGRTCRTGWRARRTRRAAGAGTGR